MNVKITIPSHLYTTLQKHLFQGKVEQGAFMFASKSSSAGELDLIVDRIHLIPAEAWDVHSSYYLELNDNEKVKIMRMAKDLDRHLIECHSHRHSHGPAYFSPSDIRGLDEFVEYVRWKLPGKIYGALVWTESSIHGQVWNGKKSSPVTVSRIQIKRDWHFWNKIFSSFEGIYKSILKGFLSIFRGMA